MLHQFRKWSYRNFEGFHVEGSHIVFTTTLVAVVDDVFPDVVFRCRLLIKVGRPSARARKVQE